VVDAESQGGGFTPGFASVLVCEDGSRHFVKAASNVAQRPFAESYREEARKLSALPESVPAPSLRWYDDGDWVVLGLEYVDAHAPARPWRNDELDLALDALEMVADRLTPVPDGMEFEPLADELALPLSTAGDVAVDHAGRPLAVSRLEDASLALSGWGRVEVSALLVVPMPDVLQRIGIGGVVAPQELAGPGRAVVLDLREGRMTEAPRDEAARALRARFGEAAIVELARCGGPNQGSELTARASVEGIDVTLKIDSGASQSSLFAVSPAGKRLSRRATGGRSAYAASGRHTVPVLSGARLRMAGFDAAVEFDLLPGERRATCPSDGFAGMNVLRTCVLVLAEDGGVAACAPR